MAWCSAYVCWGRAVEATARPCLCSGMFGRLLEVKTRYKYGDMIAITGQKVTAGDSLVKLVR